MEFYRYSYSDNSDNLTNGIICSNTYQESLKKLVQSNNIKDLISFEKIPYVVNIEDIIEVSEVSIVKHFLKNEVKLVKKSLKENWDSEIQDELDMLNEMAQYLEVYYPGDEIEENEEEEIWLVIDETLNKCAQAFYDKEDAEEFIDSYNGPSVLTLEQTIISQRRNIMEKIEDLIKELISEYEKNTKPQYYLGMSDEEASAEDARVDVYSQVIQDLYSLI